jgi:hypothetical protein
VIASRAIAGEAADAVIGSHVSLHVHAISGRERALVETADLDDIAITVPLQTKASQEEKRGCC